MELTKNKNWDLIVIGGGSGGIRAARMAASFGANVLLIEEKWLGGTCVHAGCIPKKILVYASEYASAMEDANAYGFNIQHQSFDWATLIENKNREIERLASIYHRIATEAGVTVIEGRAKVISPNQVKVHTQIYQGQYILIATGSTPKRQDTPGGHLGITSNEVFHLSQLPSSIAIIGAGFIGVELAGILHHLGVKTHLIYRSEHVLNHFDKDIGAHLTEQLKKQGIILHSSTYVKSIDKLENSYHVTMKDESTIEVSEVLQAIGRHPYTKDLGLEEIGVKTNQAGAIIVNHEFQTNVPSILACGDVIGHIALTPVALAEGMWIAKKYFGEQDLSPLDYTSIPTAVFSQPTVATVGLTEEQARKNYEVVIYRSTFKPLRHTISKRDEQALMKLIVDRKTDRVLGIHIISNDAGEMIQGFAVAIKCGATKAQFDATIGVHPTAAEELVTLRTPLSE